MGTLSAKTPNNGYLFSAKMTLKDGYLGLAASAAHPRPNNIWVPHPPPPPRDQKSNIIPTFITEYNFDSSFQTKKNYDVC